MVDITKAHAAIMIIVSGYVSVFARMLDGTEKLTIKQFAGKGTKNAMVSTGAMGLFLIYPDANPLVIAAIGGGVAAFGYDATKESLLNVIKKRKSND